ncbi:MAG: vitamin B12 dependent-methionine synthase activation domain-containing protein [Acidobacteriota bacterium]
MEIIIREVKFPLPELDTRRLIRLIGYKKKITEKTDSIISMVEECKKNSMKYIEPKYVCKIFENNEIPEHSVFNRAEKIALCICTIGNKLEDLAKKLMRENNLLEGLIYDVIGSEMAESVAVQANQRICSEAKKLKLFPSKRFSPGYGKWTLDYQRYIFELLPAESIEVTLTSHFMMVPRKSVSFAINLFDNPTKIKGSSGCKACPIKNCNFRKN